MVEVKLYDPSVLNSHEWRDLQALSRDAFNATFDRTQDEVNALVLWDDPAAYRASRSNLNSVDEQPSAAGRVYLNPRVAVATEAKQLVGYAHAVTSISVETARNRLAARMAHKNYLWVRDMAVVPFLHRRGIAKQMGKALLRDATPMQPPVVHVWPDETRFLYGTIERLGFMPTSEKHVTIFGEGSDPVRQVRMQAPTVRGVLQRM